MKNRKIYLFLTLFISLFLFTNKVNAYVYVESSDGVILPKSYDITNINSTWNINSGSYYNYSQPWLYSVGQYWGAGAVYGSHINISADYYFGVKGEAYSDADFGNQLNNTLNTLKSSNLVCGIGDMRVGYDSTFAKEITNFNVDYNVHYPDSGGWQILYHITFNYHQQIKQVNKSNTNMWCVFDRVPTNGLFLQTVLGSYSSSVRYYYYNSRFDWSVTEDATTGAINDLKTEQQETNNKLDEQIEQNKEAEETRKGIWDTIKNLPKAFLDMLLGLFIPDDMSFVTDFVDVLEDKLGFIASVPIQIIEFAINLVTTSWETFDSISLPSINIFGYNFWNAQEIDLTEAINIFKPFKYVTDVICVVLCARTLNRWRETFSGGGS